jgi:hypothetical protein
MTMNLTEVTVHLPSGDVTFTVGTDGVTQIIEHGYQGISVYTGDARVDPTKKTRYCNVAYSF